MLLCGCSRPKRGLRGVRGGPSGEGAGGGCGASSGVRTQGGLWSPMQCGARDGVEGSGGVSGCGVSPRGDAQHLCRLWDVGDACAAGWAPEGCAGGDRILPALGGSRLWVLCLTPVLLPVNSIQDSQWGCLRAVPEGLWGGPAWDGGVQSA